MLGEAVDSSEVIRYHWNSMQLQAIHDSMLFGGQDGEVILPVKDLSCY
jgi:hypothetical protein